MRPGRLEAHIRRANPIAGGRELVTLLDAGIYIKKLPKADLQLDEWPTAIECLLLVATSGGPTMLARIGYAPGIEPPPRSRIHFRPQASSLGKAQAEERPIKTVLIYVDTSKQVGDVDHLKVFANEEAAEKRFAGNDPEGVAFEYPVIGADEK
jgi:hypothetical protein